MKSLDKGEDKIQEICDQLRKETLEPAKLKAEEIVANAKLKAAEIVREGEEQVERMYATARADIEQQRNVFQSSLNQSAKQSLEALKQAVEALLSDQFEAIVISEGAKPQAVAQFITAIVHAIEKEGIDADLEAWIPKNVSPKEVAAFLGGQLLEKLKGKALSIGNFAGGAQVKLVGKNMTIDITDAALKELMASYVRKDFRKMIFAN